MKMNNWTTDSFNWTNKVDPDLSFDFPLARAVMSTEQQVFRTIMISVGLLLDSLIVIVIVLSRQLHYPRHIFWLAIALVNQLYRIQCSSEIAAIVYRNQSACQFYVLNAGVTYSMLLLCLLAAAFDRYLAIARSEWYKKKMTNKMVITIICVMEIISYMGQTSPFWTGYKKINDCTINITHMHWILVWNLFLGISCVAFHIKIFLKSKILIRQYPHRHNHGLSVVQFISKNLDSQRIESPRTGERDKLPALQETFGLQTKLNHQHTDTPSETGESETKDRNNDKSTPVSINFEEIGCFAPLRPRANRLEILAALYMSINTISFWLCTFPVTCNGIAVYWCMRLKADCSILFAINPYLHNLLQLQVIYTPIMYISNSLEFRRALKRIVKKWFPTCTVG